MATGFLAPGGVLFLALLVPITPSSSTAVTFSERESRLARIRSATSENVLSPSSNHPVAGDAAGCWMPPLNMLSRWCARHPHRDH